MNQNLRWNGKLFEWRLTTDSFGAEVIVVFASGREALREAPAELSWLVDVIDADLRAPFWACVPFDGEPYCGREMLSCQPRWFGFLHVMAQRNEELPA